MEPNGPPGKNMPQSGATALPLLSVWEKGHWKSPRAKKDASPPKLLSLLDLKHQTPRIGGLVGIDKCYQVTDCRSHCCHFYQTRTPLSPASKIAPFFIDMGGGRLFLFFSTIIS